MSLFLFPLFFFFSFLSLSPLFFFFGGGGGGPGPAGPPPGSAPAELSQLSVFYRLKGMPYLTDTKLTAFKAFHAKLVSPLTMQCIIPNIQTEKYTLEITISFPTQNPHTCVPEKTDPVKRLPHRPQASDLLYSNWVWFYPVGALNFHFFR